MKKGDVLGNGEAARVTRGKFAGLVGAVESVDIEGGRAKLHISGVVKGVPLDFREWFALSNLGRNHGKS